MEEVRKKWRKKWRNEEVIVCGFLMYEEKRPSRSVTRSVGRSIVYDTRRSGHSVAQLSSAQLVRK